MGKSQQQQSRLLWTSYPPVFAALLLLLLLLTCALSACGPSAPPARPQAVAYVVGISGSGPALNALRARDGALLWQIPIPQDSESAVVSVTATPSRVYVVSGGKPSSGDWSLLALRASDGKIAWSFLSGSMIAGIQVSGDTVYVGTRGGLRALRASDGRARWQQDGAVMSLAQAGDTLYAAFAGGAAGSDRVAALRANDGALLWQAQPGASAWQVLVDQTTLYVTTASGVLALQISDGAQRWRSENAGAWVFGVAAGNVYLSQISPRAGSLAALRASDGMLRWQRSLLSGWYGAPIATDNAVYGEVSADTVCALRPGAGTLAWCYQVHQPALLAANNETAYISDAAGTLCALRAGDGSRRWCQQHQATSSLVIAADGLLLTTPGGAVCALQAASGTEVWRRRVADAVFDLTVSP